MSKDIPRPRSNVRDTNRTKLYSVQRVQDKIKNTYTDEYSSKMNTCNNVADGKLV